MNCPSTEVDGTEFVSISNSMRQQTSVNRLGIGFITICRLLKRSPTPPPSPHQKTLKNYSQLFPIPPLFFFFFCRSPHSYVLERIETDGTDFLKLFREIKFGLPFWRIKLRMSFWVNNSTPFSLTTACSDPLTKSVWVRRENQSKLGHHVLYLERVQN